MNVKKFARLIICNSAFILFLSSCSIQKKIDRSAKKDVLEVSALQTAHVGISIYEPSTGKYWYNYNGEKYFVPASNVKIPTCYAAMKYLGDSLVGLRYVRQGDALLILPTGDPTFLHPDFANQPVFDFLKNDTAQKMIWGTYTFEAEAWGNGWSWNDYDQRYMAERSPFPIHGNVVTIRDTGNTFPGIHINKSMVAGAYDKGYRIERSLSGDVFTAVGSGKPFTETDIPFRTNHEFVSQLLQKTIGLNSIFVNNQFLQKSHPDKSIHSQPTDSVLKPMMHRSDNFFAEQVLLMVSDAKLAVMNDKKIIDTILKTDLKDLPQKPGWADGSGLSRYNLFTPQALVAILSRMKNEFGMERIKVIFPTGGKGTLTNYYMADSTYIYAKTGTLSGVVALSGYLYTKKGKELIFSVLVNNHKSSATEVRRAVEQFLQQLRNKY